MAKLVLNQTPPEIPESVAMVKESSLPVQKFFQSLGFAWVETVKGDEDAGEDMYLMVLRKDAGPICIGS